jgi:hypothetical protein
MDSTKERPDELTLDPELLGHDPELASAVRSLQHAAHARPDPGTSGVPHPREPSSPSNDGRFVSRRPSGFLTRALPLYWSLPAHRRVPWKALLVAASVAVVFASVVAWAMVYLLRPNAFRNPGGRGAASAPETRPPAAAHERTATASAQPLPAPTALVSPDPSPEAADPERAREGSEGHRAAPETLARRVSKAAPRPKPDSSASVAGAEPPAAASAPGDVPVPAPQPKRRTWFE